MANEECRGCYLIRLFTKEHHPDKISCEHEKLDCPCKTCLVKVTCDMIAVNRSCEPFIKFNIEHPTNEYWIKEKEKYNREMSTALIHMKGEL